MKFHVVTLFPELVEAYAAHSIIGRAVRNKVLSIKTYQLRNFARNKWNKVDDRPYAGGPGMVLQAEPILHAVEKILGRNTPIYGSISRKGKEEEKGEKGERGKKGKGGEKGKEEKGRKGGVRGEGKRSRALTFRTALNTLSRAGAMLNAIRTIGACCSARSGRRWKRNVEGSMCGAHFAIGAVRRVDSMTS